MGLEWITPSQPCLDCLNIFSSSSHKKIKHDGMGWGGVGMGILHTKGMADGLAISIVPSSLCTGCGCH